MMDSSETPTSGAVSSQPSQRVLLDRRGRRYEPAIGPRLKIVLAVLFVGVALLGATGVYLLALRLLGLARGQDYTNPFVLGTTLVHLLGGIIFIVPFLFFGCFHLATARKRPNRKAVRLGITLFITGIAACLTGLALAQLHEKLQLPTGSVARWVVYALHLITPVAAAALYILHRRAGPDLKWQWGAGWGLSVAGFVIVMAYFQMQDPRKDARGSAEGEKYFNPSLARTPDAKFLEADTLTLDSYCLKCHADIYGQWFHSAHHFSSFNNPPYLFSVRKTREVMLKRDGNVKGARWCAGCHDVVPFFSGKFDDPKYDDVNDPTSQAGITCVACHAITHIDSTLGNAAYTIDEPPLYPFTKSDNWFLQLLNNQMIKANPDFHKRTFLKPFHRSAEFCSTCHKVSLPLELNHYKDFLRGQNHYDSYRLSGVSGINSRSFYYPPVAKTRCAECHMPLTPSNDFGSRLFDDSGVRKVHGHDFPGGNTGLPWLLSQDPKKAADSEGFRQAAQKQADFLKDKKVRVDLFGLKEGDGIDGRLLAPLRPELPALQPGHSYLVEVVVRTVNLGHPFSQGTVDSNEIWVDFLARSGARIIGRSGALDGPDDSGKVDEWSHFINVLMLDRDGHRINRRNPEDIFTPLYDHQIPPGAAQVVHYHLDVPADLKDPVELNVRVRYRKFDFEYMSLVHGGDDKVPRLAIVDLCSDKVTLPVAGSPAEVPAQTSAIDPPWQRWNDYGIGLFLAANADTDRAGLRQAVEAFEKLTALEDPVPQAHGHLNLARSYSLAGDLPKVLEELTLIRERKLPAPWWSVAWFTGLLNERNGHLEEAVANFEQILDPKNQPRDRKFDFGGDDVVLNELGQTLFRLAQQESGDKPEEKAERQRLLLRAVQQFERTLHNEPEDVDAHFGLMHCFRLLAEDAVLPAESAASTGTAGLVELSQVLANGSESVERRLVAAGGLARLVADLGNQPPTPEVPRLATIVKLRQTCRKAYDEAVDPRLKAADAQLLASLHQILHSLYKPDENAKNRTVTLYLKDHKAADLASQPIAIYPTNRPSEPTRKTGTD
jgi:hypothetical protein